MNEFELAGHTYRVGKIPAMQQFHLSRKVAPIIPTLVPVFTRLQAGAAASQDGAAAPLTANLDATAEALSPFTEAIAEMPNEAAEFVLSTCLSVVQRQQGTTWSSIWSGQHNTPMFDDIDLGVMLQLAVRVIILSLGPTLAGLLTGPRPGSPAGA